MRRRTIAIACVGLIATASACYYLGSRGTPWPATAAAATTHAVAGAADRAAPDARTAGFARTSGGLPPPGAALHSVFAELRARAEAGDGDAATRLYRDLSLCGRFRSIDWANAQLADELLGERIDDMAPDQLENYRAQLEAIESRKRNVQRLHALCDGTDEAMLAAVVPALHKAAQLGEPHARACYLAVGPNYDARGLMRHPERLEAYRASVPRLIDAGLAAGDWKVVDILRKAYQPGSEGLLTGVLDPDPYQYYRYLKLYRLGAETYRARELDRQLAIAATQLAFEQRIAADAWAETMFERNFDDKNSTGTTVTGWDPCAFPYE